MNIIIKKISEDEKLEVVPFLVDEYESLILELNPNIKHFYSGSYGDCTREMDKRYFVEQMRIKPIIYAAYDEDKIVGAGFINSTGYLDSLFVKEDYRNQTIGSKLLKHLIDECSHLQVIRVEARIDAISLYERFSFHKVDGKRNSAFVPMELERGHHGK